MERNVLIEKTVKNIDKLSDQHIQEIADFAEFLVSKTQDQILLEDIQRLTSESKTFDFLQEEPELYSVKDLKTVYK